jgi:hypothetical protein
VKEKDRFSEIGVFGVSILICLLCVIIYIYTIICVKNVKLGVEYLNIFDIGDE